ncbi:MAG: hypothetical protein P3A31_08480, partial [Gemmatimonadota bacterium]|nr:hypothetical protein [Gemmatimonadota bacterium]
MRVTRTQGVHLVLVGFAVALLARSGWVQLRQRAQWQAEARDQQTVERAMPAVRGRILDAAGIVLVDSRELVRLDVAPSEIRDRAALAAALRRIGVAEAFVQRATDLGRKWVELPGQHLATDVGDLLAMRGVHPRRVIERVPPATAGLRNLLGVVDREGRAVGGVESALDGALRGRDGRTVLVRAGRNGPLTSPEERVEPPVPGQTVVLTLHQGLQDIAERSLADAITALGARGGDVVVLDPRDGAIRALASRR